MPKPSKATLEVGYWVAVCLTPGAAPQRCYVGQVQAVDPQGLRLTLLDWFVGRATDWDLFVAWPSLTAALVATPAHDLTGFADSALRWCRGMEASVLPSKTPVVNGTFDANYENVSD